MALQRALEAVFGQPAFARELARADDDALSLGQLLLRRLRELLKSFLEWFEELHGTSPLLYWLLFAALVALLLALVAHIAWTFRQAFALDLPASDEPDEVREKVRRYHELREQSTRLAAQGAWREAARLLLLALLALIEERKVLHLARGWTNREILQHLTLPPAEGAALDAFRRRVEDAWYGGHALDSAQLGELAVCIDRCAEVLRAPNGAKGHP